MFFKCKPFTTSPGNGARAARGAWAGRGGVSGAGEIRAVDPGIWGRASGFAGGRRVRRSTAVGPAGGRRVRRSTAVGPAGGRSGRARSTAVGRAVGPGGARSTGCARSTAVGPGAFDVPRPVGPAGLALRRRGGSKTPPV